jgi:LysM repeat protein
MVSEREPITCFACENEPTQQCPRCGRPYCDDHGDELCAVCLQPASGIPSFTLYRGSLLALLIGSALAIWLLVRPPGSEGETAIRPIVINATATAAGAIGEPPGGATQAPASTQPAGTTATPGTAGPATATRPTGTATTNATPTTAAGGGSYTVVSGDTLSGICSARRPNLNNSECVNQIVSRNGLSSPNDIAVGDVLQLP